MRSRILIAGGLVAALALPAFAGLSSPEQEADAWHASRIEALRRDDGWLSLVGLFALPDGTHTFGSNADADLHLEGDYPASIARLTVESGQVHFEAVAPSTVDGAPVQDTPMAADVTGEPTVVETGSLLYYVIERDGRPYLRVKDRKAPLLSHFEGIERWPFDASFRIEAEWVAYEEPVSLQVPSVLGYSEAFDCPGEARFRIGDTDLVLRPTSVGNESMSFIFGDATNGIESYGAGRFVVTGKPVDGRLLIDFNRAYNPPCVFTPFATCPLPPEGNTLSVEILAGEKMFGEAH